MGVFCPVVISQRGLCKMQASSILVVTTALLCFLALGSATADERVKKEAKMKTISSPSGGYNSITDKMLRFVMIKTSADMASSCAMSRTDSYFYLTLDGDVLGDCISTKFPSGLFEYEIHTNLHERYCPEYVILLFTDGTQLECEVKTDLFNVESFRCIG